LNGIWNHRTALNVIFYLALTVKEPNKGKICAVMSFTVSGKTAAHFATLDQLLFNRYIYTHLVLVINLSTADLFFVISLPLRIYYYHQKARITFILKYISLYGGIFFLVCIAVDRYFAVVHPLASTLRRRRVAQVVSGGIWCLVLGLSMSLPLLRSAATHQSQPCLLDPSSQRHRTIILVALGLVLGSFLLPTLILLYSYCRVLSVLSQSRHRCRSHRRGRRHTLRVIYWVLGVFLLCFLPYHVNLLGYTLTHMELLPHCGLAKVTKAVHPVVLSLASFNCCLNPLIYYFSSSLVHREVFTKTCCSL
uniref:G-protein coupled receptors family 1 profile domain-containing protein n=1 Tax=Stegastes partitus TaxID=144197 RepID=A0A3B4ZFM9_9TELE